MKIRLRDMPTLLLGGAILTGCGPSEDEIRNLVQNELQKASVKVIISEGTPIGPYSPAVKVGNFLFVSGQIGMNPDTQQLAGRDVASQTKQALQNLNGVLFRAGYDSTHVIQCNVFLKDMNDFQSMNLIYGGYFPENRYPARTTVEVSNLPRNAVVEIAAIAYKDH